MNNRRKNRDVKQRMNEEKQTEYRDWKETRTHDGKQRTIKEKQTEDRDGKWIEYRNGKGWTYANIFGKNEHAILTGNIRYFGDSSGCPVHSLHLVKSKEKRGVQCHNIISIFVGKTRSSTTENHLDPHQESRSFDYEKAGCSAPEKKNSTTWNQADLQRKMRDKASISTMENLRHPPERKEENDDGKYFDDG